MLAAPPIPNVVGPAWSGCPGPRKDVAPMSDSAATASAVPVTPRNFGASLADPGPLGLAAFALTTFVLSTANAGILPKAAEPVVFGLALFYGGIVQVLAGLWEYAKGNTFGATAFCSYGAFWMAFWYLVTHAVPMMVAGKATGAQIEQGVGVFLLAWTIFTGIMLIGSFHTNGVLVVVFSLLFITFVGLTIGALGSAPSVTKIAGWFGLLTAAGAWYGAAAAVINSTAKRTVLPTWPR